MHILAVGPHYRHLVAKPPRLEPLDQTIECNSGGAHFLLVVRKAIRLVVGDRIVIVAASSGLSSRASHTLANLRVFVIAILA